MKVITDHYFTDEKRLTSIAFKVVLGCDPRSAVKPMTSLVYHVASMYHVHSASPR